MNIPITPVLPGNSSSSAPVNANKTVNSKPNSGKKSSFSDKLDNAVSRTETEAPGEQEQAPDTKLPTKLLINTLPITLLINNSNSDNSPISLEDSASLDSEILNSDDTATVQPMEDLLSALNTPVLVAPIMLPDTTGDVAATTELTPPVSVTALAPSETSAAPILPEIPAAVTSEQSATQPTANNNQTGTVQDLVAQLLQKGQETPGSNKVTNQSNAPQVTLPSHDAGSIMPGMATTTPGQVQNSAISARENEELPESGQQVPVVAVNQPGENLQKDLAGEGQKDTTASDSHLLDKSKLIQDLKVSPAADGLHTQTFAQGLHIALQSVHGTTAEVQAQATPVADVYQVADQIVEQTKIIAKPQNTEMIIKLRPEHLGELTLKVAVENGVVNASFHSSNAEVRNVIEASLPQLKQDLANTGLKVDNVSVYAGLSQFLPNHDQDRNSRQQQMKFTNKKSADDFVEAIDGELTNGKASGIANDSGVDYRI